jgi:hypothetical protein
MMTARYAVTPRLTLMLTVPHREIRSPKDVGGSADKHIDRHFSGLGDSLLLTRSQLNAPAPEEGPTYYALAGVRLPTGGANPNHTWTARDGSRILSRDPVLQPGFGSVDPIVGFQVARSLPGDRNVFLGLLYRHTGGTNDYGYRYGNEFQVTTGAALPLRRGITFTPQLFAQFSGHDRDFRPLPGKPSGIVSNTGGTWLYFMPNLRYGAVELSLQVPIYRKTNGNILNPKLILGLRTNVDLALTRHAREARDGRPAKRRDQLPPRSGEGGGRGPAREGACQASPKVCPAPEPAGDATE